MSDYSVHIVIDNGCNTCKAGFNGENAPRVVVPTVFGTSKNSFLNLIEDDNVYQIGRNALNNPTTLQLDYPLKNGIITDFDKMEKIWSYIFYSELKAKPEAHNVFLTENLYSSNKEREKMAEIMFEKFSIFNIHIEPQPIMTLYSTAKTTGLIIESSESMTQIVPIFERYIIPQGIKSSELAGNIITKEFHKMIKNKLKTFNVNNEFEISKKIKEKFCELTPTKKIYNDSYIHDPTQGQCSNEFILPDGNSINIGSEKFMAPEILFNPGLFDYDMQNIQSLIFDSVKSVDLHLRKDMIGNIILGGGNTMLKNFPERLKYEISKLFTNSDENLKIKSENERLYSAWIGASVACSISSLQQMWISKNDFEEIGPNIIHKKYFF